MKVKYFILPILFLLPCSYLGAQSLAQARAWYERGEYAKAKPVFQKLVKSQPNNGNYNLWYGVCCLQTNETQLAVKHLQTAVRRRATGGQYHLSKAYNANYQFDKAIETCQEYIDELTKRKRDTSMAEQLLARCKANLRMIKGVEQVCFIDSFVVDKAQFLSAYKVSAESGQLFMYQDYFKNDSNAEGTVYQTELANKIYYSELQPDSTLSILSSNKQLGLWSKGQLLPGSINEAMNANYPFVLTDGITIYYAADGAASMGGYDIFVTRYNTNTDSYLEPENVGMPFNSPYNDYMYVIDEFSNLGWFASDRYQPEGKVCVYLFIPNGSKKVYNYESTPPHILQNLAKLWSVKDTWDSDELVNAARQRLEKVNKASYTQSVYDFEFVINDHLTYHFWNDFRSAKAKTLFQKLTLMKKNYQSQQDKLWQMRDLYQNSPADEQRKLTPTILDLEKSLLNIETKIEAATLQIRELELK